MNNNKNNIEKMISCLKQEITWIDELNTLLGEEQTILTKREFNELERLADKKQVLSDQLENSGRERMGLMSGNTNVSPRLGLKEFLKTCTAEEVAEIGKLNTSLVERLTLCRELNTINGQVIATNIHTRQQIVNALSGNKGGGVNLYTSTGDIKPSTPGDSGHHQEA